MSGCVFASDWSDYPLIHKRQELKVDQKLYEPIKIGMTEEEVRQRWGAPHRISEKNVNGSDYVWIYKPHWKFRNQLYFKDGVLIGGEPDPEEFF